MQLCDLSLRQWLDTRNSKVHDSSFDSIRSTVNEEDSKAIFHQILCGLEYIHDANLIHRDIKPSNIFLSHNDSSAPLVQIGDFGLTRHITANSEPITPLGMAQYSGNLSYFDVYHTEGVGTTIYAAPEQLHTNDYSNKVDLYSTGIVLFEIMWPISTQHERVDALNLLRKGKVPHDFMNCWPGYGVLLKSLLNDLPEKRLSANCILQSRLFNKNDIQNTSSQMLQIAELLVKNQELQLLAEKYKHKLVLLGVDPDTC